MITLIFNIFSFSRWLISSEPKRLVLFSLSSIVPRYSVLKLPVRVGPDKLCNEEESSKYTKVAVFVLTLLSPLTQKKELPKGLPNQKRKMVFLLILKTLRYTE